MTRSAEQTTGPVLVGSVLPPAIGRDWAAERLVMAAQKLVEAVADGPRPDVVAVRRLTWRLAQAHVLSGLVCGSLADALTLGYSLGAEPSADTDRLVSAARADVWAARQRSELAARALSRARVRLGQVPASS